MMKKTENLILLAVFGLIGLFFVAGCENDSAKLNIFQPKEVETEDPTDANERARLTKENKILKRDIEKLQADNEILTSRVDELTDRQRKLTQKLTEVQLDNRQMKKAVEIYKELPAERDRYKLKYESAMRTVVKLKTELDKYQAGEKTAAKPAVKAAPKPAEKPTSKPVSKKSHEAKSEASPMRPATSPATQPVVESLPKKLPVTMPTTIPTSMPTSRPEL